MVPGSTLTEKATLLREWGYDAIAVFQPLESWNDGVHEELATLAERTGIVPAEFVLIDEVYGHAMSPDLSLRSRCRAMYRETASVCAEIGAVTEIEFEYGPQNPLPLFDPFQQLDAAQKGDFIDFYLEMLDLVSGSSARVLLEPINRYESGYLNRVIDNLEIIDAVAHPNAGLLPDTFHMSIEESDLADVLRRAAGRIAHVHLGDSNRLLPGHGHLDWVAIFAALREIGYAGYVNLECSSEGDPARSLPENAAFLRELIRG
jgi:sugar phosphate isomerase/epimerase